MTEREELNMLRLRKATREARAVALAIAIYMLFNPGTAFIGYCACVGWIALVAFGF